MARGTHREGATRPGSSSSRLEKVSFPPPSMHRATSFRRRSLPHSLLLFFVVFSFLFCELPLLDRRTGVARGMRDAGAREDEKLARGGATRRPSLGRSSTSIPLDPDSTHARNRGVPIAERCRPLRGFGAFLPTYMIESCARHYHYCSPSRRVGSRRRKERTSLRAVREKDREDES